MVVAVKGGQLIALDGLLAFAADFTQPEKVQPGVDSIEPCFLPEYQPWHLLLEAPGLYAAIEADLNALRIKQGSTARATTR